MRIRLFVAVVLLMGHRAFACSCIPPDSPEAALEYAHSVFAGVVESIADPYGERLKTMSDSERELARRVGPATSRWGPDYGRKVTLRVLQWWKGDDPTETIAVWTGYARGDCGYPLEQGYSYLVYARRNPEARLELSICSFSKALVCGLDDVAALGHPLKTFSSIDRDSLIAKEAPYTTYWRPCITPPLLIGERGLTMESHCRVAVRATIGRDGLIPDFEILSPPSNAYRCGSAEFLRIREKAPEWRFRPGTIDGEPVETLLTHVSMREPVTEAEQAESLKRWEGEKRKRDRQ